MLRTYEKTSIQARERTHEETPAQPEQTRRGESEYDRNGALQYLAAWDVHRGIVLGRCEKSGIKPFELLVDQVLEQTIYEKAKRLFFIVDKGSSHRGQAGFRTDEILVATTQCDPACNSRDDIADLYHHRWRVELKIRDIKQALVMDILRGNTPMMLRREIWAHLLAYNLISQVIAQAALTRVVRHGRLALPVRNKCWKHFERFCRSKKVRSGCVRSRWCYGRSVVA